MTKFSTYEIILRSVVVQFLGDDDFLRMYSISDTEVMERIKTREVGTRLIFKSFLSEIEALNLNVSSSTLQGILEEIFPNIEFEPYSDLLKHPDLLLYQGTIKPKSEMLLKMI